MHRSHQHHLPPNFFRSDFGPIFFSSGEYLIAKSSTRLDLYIILRLKEHDDESMKVLQRVQPMVSDLYIFAEAKSFHQKSDRATFPKDC